MPGTAPPVKRQAPAGCGLPELAMIKYFSAVYAQSVSGGRFKSFSHHKEHNGIGWRTTQRGRNGGMEGRKRIAVVGSDARQAAAGRALARAGYAVAGAEQVARADVILLPLPLDESRTPLAQLLRAAKPGAFALGGRLSAQAVEIARQAGVELADYFARPELAVYNAIPTAEGCIGILLQQRTRTLWGAEVLVLGFGPVGQALAVRLSALGAGVTVCARRPEQRALAESLGLRAAPLTALAGLAPAFDTVVNTIPAPVLGDGVLARLRSGSLIVDLASKPGGTDFAAAAPRGDPAPSACRPPARRRRRARRWRVRCRPCCRSGRGGHDDHTEPRNDRICGVRQLLYTGSSAAVCPRPDSAGLAAAAGDEFCRPAGHPLWHGKLLEGAAGSRRRAPGTGHAAGGGAAGPPQNGAGTGGSPLHRGHAFPAGGGPVRHAGDAGGQEPAAGGLPGGAGRVHQRRAGCFRREHRPAVPAQALLFCALRAG